MAQSACLTLDDLVQHYSAHYIFLTSWAEPSSGQGLKFRRNFAEFRRNFSFPLGTGKKYFGIFGKFRFENSKFKKIRPKFAENHRNSGTEFRFRQSPGFHRKTKWLTLSPTRPASRAPLASTSFCKRKSLLYLLQFSRKFNFPPPTTKPVVWPPPILQNRSTFLPYWFEDEVTMVLIFFFLDFSYVQL